MKREVWERKFGPPEERTDCTLRTSVQADAVPSAAMDMGLGAGGRMRQELYDDPHSFEDRDLRHSSRCFVHLTNALVWRAVTGRAPPTTPPTSEEYTEAGLPWFDYYAADREALEGSEELARLKSVLGIAREKGDVALSENESVDPERVIALREGLEDD